MKNKQSGFTLIEMLFYILFITFIIGGTLGIVQNLLRNSQVLKTGISIEEEGNFILKKISWAVNDSNIGTPSAGSTSASLAVTKNGGGTMAIDLSGGIVRIDSGSGFKQLSNDRFTFSDLNFEHGWDGSNPDTELIKASFNINGQPFQLTRKVR